jgi:F0F1-type ATP synthase membrane subunit b/b'
MRKSNTGLEDASTALENKKTQLRDDEQSFEAILQKSRNEYAQNRQKLISQIDLLKQKIENNSETTDDALQIRSQTCQEIRSAIDRAILRVKSKSPQENTYH